MRKIKRRSFIAGGVSLIAIPTYAERKMRDCGWPDSPACQFEDEAKRSFAQTIAERARSNEATAAAISRRNPGFQYFIASKGSKRHTVRSRVVPSLDYKFLDLEVHVHQLPTLNTGRLEGATATVDIWSTSGLGKNKTHADNVSTVVLRFDGDIWGRLKIGSFTNECAVFYRFNGIPYENSDLPPGCYPGPCTPYN